LTGVKKRGRRGEDRADTRVLETDSRTRGHYCFNKTDDEKLQVYAPSAERNSSSRPKKEAGQNTWREDEGFGRTIMSAKSRREKRKKREE